MSVMLIPIDVSVLPNAEKFSSICCKYSDEFYLRSGQYCINPRSMLGVLAIFYSTKSDVAIDTGDMDDETIEKFKADIADYIRK